MQVSAEPHQGALAGHIQVNEAPLSSAQVRGGGAPAISFPAAGLAMGPVRHRDVLVKFSGDAAVPFPFRNVCITTQVALAGNALVPLAEERVLASCDEGALWTASEINGIQHFRSAVPLIDIGPEESFSEVFSGERFFNNLPLLHFLRKASGCSGFQPAPLRAAFMFDDPNLHWKTYGLVNYSEIAAHAARQNYHVSFATIPLDTWYTNSATAKAFRENARVLSLLVHGNNHSKHELSVHHSIITRAAILAQANHRIERLERSARLQVSRVMVPPHGACSEAMLEGAALWDSNPHAFHQAP